MIRVIIAAAALVAIATAANAGDQQVGCNACGGYAEYTLAKRLHLPASVQSLSHAELADWFNARPQYHARLVELDRESGRTCVGTAANVQTVPLPPNFPRDAVKAYCAAAVDSFGSMTFVTHGGGLNSGVGPVEWRCSKGAVLICPAGADGINCSARSRRRDPTPEMVRACREDVNGAGEHYMSVATGAYGYVWDWECRGDRPVIAGPAVTRNLQTGKTTPIVFDAQGYRIDEWEPLR